MVSCEKSEAVQLYWKWKDNETILGPSVLQTWDCPPSEWLPLLIIAGVLWIATLVVCMISLSRFDSYRWSKTFIHLMSRRVIYFYLIFSLLNVFTIVNSRGTIAYQYMSDLVEALCFLNFYMLIWSYTGGAGNTVKKMIGLELNLGQAPFCCLRFLPNIKISERFLWWTEKLLLQLPVVQFVAGLLNATLIGSGISATLFEHWATTLLNIIMTISFALSMYAIGTLFACWSQFVVGRQVRAKFAIFKVTIILSKVQTVVLDALSDKVDTIGYYSGKNRTEMWGAFIVCAECLILSVAASFLYKKSDYDTAVGETIRYKKNVDEVNMDLENGMEEVDLGKPALVIQNQNIV